MTVLIDFKGLFEQYSDTLKDQINAYHDLGYTILVAVNYDWICTKFNSENTNWVKTYLESKDIEFDNILVNFQTQLMYEENSNWALNPDIVLP